MDIISTLSSTEERRLLAYASTLALTDLEWDENVISGLIGVRNHVYEKRVFVRITYNYWENFVDFEAVWLEGDGSIDLFSFRLTWPEESTDALFAISATQNEFTAWDNNRGRNYHILRLRDPTPSLLPPPLDETGHSNENLGHCAVVPSSSNTAVESKSSDTKHLPSKSVEKEEQDLSKNSTKSDELFDDVSKNCNDDSQSNAGENLSMTAEKTNDEANEKDQKSPQLGRKKLDESAQENLFRSTIEFPEEEKSSNFSKQTDQENCFMEVRSLSIVKENAIFAKSNAGARNTAKEDKPTLTQQNKELNELHQVTILLNENNIPKKIGMIAKISDKSEKFVSQQTNKSDLQPLMTIMNVPNTTNSSKPECEMEIEQCCSAKEQLCIRENSLSDHLPSNRDGEKVINHSSGVMKKKRGLLRRITNFFLKKRFRKSKK